MLATYASALLVLFCAAAVGQAIFVVCGRRRWSWLAPAVGLAAVLAVAWWAVRLPGEGTAAVIALGALTLIALAVLAGRADGLGHAARTGAPVALLALAAASVPYLVEARVGILGTGLNPDMSQHLLAADRLAASGSERLISSGYPLGPHSLAVALEALGPSLVQGFGAITVATAAITALAPLGLLGRIAPWRRVAVALLVAFAYMTASYLVQGAFKETMQALFLLAFAIGLGSLRGGRLGRRASGAVPLAVLAAGSVYVYSFPGLIWIGGALGAWGLGELCLLARRRGLGPVVRRARRARRPFFVAVAAFAALVAAEAGRMAEFAGFETFDPAGEGLGNLFNRISPLEALGVWPSGDFRVEPGAGAVPEVAFWAGAAVAVAALAFGLVWWWRRGHLAVPAAFVSAAGLAVAAALAGTPYQGAKAIALAAPLAMLVSARALAQAAPSWERIARILRHRQIAPFLPRTARRARLALAAAALATAFGAGAALSSLLALANGPVGPSRWGPEVLEAAPFAGATLVLAPQAYLDGENGRDLIVWELRGGRVCVSEDGAPTLNPPPPGVRQVLVYGRSRSPRFDGLGDPERVGEWTLWPVTEPAPGSSGCPYVADGDRAAPSA